MPIFRQFGLAFYEKYCSMEFTDRYTRDEYTRVWQTAKAKVYIDLCKAGVSPAVAWSSLTTLFEEILSISRSKRRESIAVELYDDPEGEENDDKQKRWLRRYFRYLPERFCGELDPENVQHEADRVIHDHYRTMLENVEESTGWASDAAATAAAGPPKPPVPPAPGRRRPKVECIVAQWRNPAFIQAMKRAIDSHFDWELSATTPLQGNTDHLVLLIRVLGGIFCAFREVAEAHRRRETLKDVLARELLPSELALDDLLTDDIKNELELSLGETPIVEEEGEDENEDEEE